MNFGKFYTLRLYNLRAYRLSIRNVLFIVFIFSVEIEGAKSARASGNEDFQQVVIDEPFIEMRTGAGRGYPIFHIVEKGENVFILKIKTQWYKVRSSRGKEGWVHETQMQQTLTLEGEAYQIKKTDWEAFISRNYEVGVLAGDFGGANVMSIYAGWNWTRNIMGELAISQALGNASDIQYANLSVIHQPFPEWWVSPYFKVGGGMMKTSPRSTIVLPVDRKDETLLVGMGARAYVARQFFVRLEYTSYTVLTSRNDNDEIDEWKLGVSVFF